MDGAGREREQKPTEKKCMYEGEDLVCMCVRSVILISIFWGIIATKMEMEIEEKRPRKYH